MIKQSVLLRLRLVLFSCLGAVGILPGSGQVVNGGVPLVLVAADMRWICLAFAPVRAACTQYAAEVDR